MCGAKGKLAISQCSLASARRSRSSERASPSWCSLSPAGQLPRSAAKTVILLLLLVRVRVR
eukprot:scaffold73242_cov32-Phaeocystis_antarctica.AAC.1